MSMFSFHATKVFHSIEGGLLTFRDSALQSRLDYLKNFGFENETEVVMPGTNAKMSEFHALMGTLLITRVEEMIEARRTLTEHYYARLGDIPGIRLPAQPREGVRHNYAYLSIEVDQDTFGMTRDDLYEQLRAYNVIARRYFYPIIPDFPCYRSMFGGVQLPVARSVSARILTLPLFSDLRIEDVDRICDIVEYLHHGSRSAATMLTLSSPEAAVRL